MSRVEELLEPIEGGTGSDVEYADDYAELGRLRSLTNVAEGTWTPDWDGVAEIGTEILGKQSKDIRVALYLAEALLHVEGFAGFSEGLQVVQAILERFPDDAYPQDPDERAYALDFLVGALKADTREPPEVVRAVDLFPLTEWEHRIDHYQAWVKAGGAAATGDAGDGDEPTADNFGRGFVDTPKSYYKELDAGLPASLSALSALQAWGDEYFKDKVDQKETPVPRYTKLETALKRAQKAAKALLEKKLVDDPDPVGSPEPIAAGADDTASEDEGGASTPAPVAAVALSAEPNGEEDAVQRVASVARWLRSQGPTDPAPYMLVRALRWGELRRSSPLDRRLLEPPDTPLRRSLTGLLVDEAWAELLEAGEEVMAQPCGRGWLDLQRYVLTAVENLGAEYASVGTAIRGQLSALLTDVPELLEITMMDDMPTCNAQTLEWLELTGLVGGEAAATGAGAGDAPEYDRERVMSEATHERALALAASGNARQGVQMLMKRADREESPRARFITESLAASVMVDAGMLPVARPMLEDLEKTIEGRKLAEWESAEVVARPLGLLFRCLPANDRKRSDLYDKICRLAPMHALSLDSGSAGPASAPATQPASSTRGQPFQANESSKPSPQDQAVDSGSTDKE